jgi:hypothetical protein
MRVILSAVFVLVLACATQPTPKSYQATSPDEEKIIDLVLEFQKAYTSNNMQRILATYPPGAMIKTSMTSFQAKKKDWSGVMVPKEKHAEVLAKQMGFYKRVGIKLEIGPPKDFDVLANEASMNAPYELYSTNPYRRYVESGLLYFDFKKTDSGWLISRRSWDVLECNHPDFKEWKARQK